MLERVFRFCDEEQVQKFFVQVTEFEKKQADEWICLIKIWLNVGRAEQLRRFLKRKRDPITMEVVFYRYKRFVALG